MARYAEMTEEELTKHATELGVENTGSMTREQLIAALAEKAPEDPEAVPAAAEGGAKSDFVTPVEAQGEVPSGADDKPREVTGAGGEMPPAEGDVADQQSLGGTGGTTTGVAPTPGAGGTGVTGSGGAGVS